MTDTFEWKAHANSSGSNDFTLSKAQFGDGYVQTAPLGINAETQRWSVTVGAYTSEAREIADWLRDHKGEAFFWTPPLSDEGLYQCDGYKPTFQGGGYYTINAEFYQVRAP